jgi:uncharacterized repeat protein (TIGR01451 family)
MLGLAVLLVPVTGAAQAVTPVAVTVSSTFYSYDEAHLIDNSGLSGALHDTIYPNQWVADRDDTQPWLVFDLGNQCDLTSALIWQYSVDGVENRGVNGLDILLSTDGINFTLATSTNLAIATGGDLPAQTVTFAEATARYVRFEVTSNHGSASFTGLAEVKFGGLPSAGADLAVTKTVNVAGILHPGDQITYTIGVTNNGPSDATGVGVTDALPAQVVYVSDTCGGTEAAGTWTWTIGALANGGSAACDLVAEVVPGANGPIENTAAASGNESDPTPDNDSATAPARGATRSGRLPDGPRTSACRDPASRGR